MKEFVLVALMLAASATTFAESDVDCSNTDEIGRDDVDQLEKCASQAENNLNKVYKELREMHKDSEEKQAALKEMQLGWIKMRKAQCLFRSMNSASGAALTGVQCEMEMAVKRTLELADL